MEPLKVVDPPPLYKLVGFFTGIGIVTNTRKTCKHFVEQFTRILACYWQPSYDWQSSISAAALIVTFPTTSLLAVRVGLARAKSVVSAVYRSGF